jgi:hypothetical protein|tara:strand:- start:2030 stop:2527 length:498 start_codon:yes stop_codon:yes gene_type:complete
MTTNIIHKKSAIEGKAPLVNQLQYGELALNTYDGAIYLKRNQGGSDELVTIGQTTEDNLNVDTTGYVNSSGEVLSQVLSDLDAAIQLASNGGVAVDPDSILGAGTVQSPFNVTLDSVLAGGSVTTKNMTVNDLTVTGSFNGTSANTLTLSGATLDDIVALSIALG